MFRCPLCENLSYDWHDTDSMETKLNTMKIVKEHFDLNHPEPISTSTVVDWVNPNPLPPPKFTPAPS